MKITSYEFENFRDCVRQTQRRWEDIVEKAIAEVIAKGTIQTVAEARLDILEDQVRQHIIDHWLSELGWLLDDPSHLLTEAGVAPVTPNGEPIDGKRRFLDYAGYERSGERYLLVVEAKRPRIRLPRCQPNQQTLPSSTTIAEDLTYGVQIAKLGAAGHDEEANKIEDRPDHELTKEWIKYLSDLHDYVSRCKGLSGEPPKRVIMTNGDWLVVFKEPESTFLAGGRPAGRDISVYQNHQELMANYKEVVNLCSFKALSSEIPPLLPNQLKDYLGGENPTPVSNVLKISYDNVSRDTRPELTVEAALLVHGRENNWVICEMPSTRRLPKDRTDRDWKLGLTRQNTKAALEDMKKLKKNFSELHRVVKEDTGRKIKLKPLEEVQPYLKETEEWNDGEPLLSDKSTNGFFYLVIGNASELIKEPGDYAKCSFHNWSDCDQVGQAMDHILEPSTKPRAYFPSGQHLHCAQCNVHNERKNHCLIQGFEQYLCCHSCVFNDACWGSRPDVLPCKSE